MIRHHLAIRVPLDAAVHSPGPGAWPWALGLGAVLFVPWLTGGAIGWVVRRRDSPGPG